MRRRVDDAVAHHAAVEQQIPRRHQPVADVIGQDAAAASGAGDLALERRVPPDMIDIDGDADAVAQRIAEIIGLGQRIDAGAVGGIHRVQRLDRQLHAGVPRIRQQRGDPVADQVARGGEIARARRQPADHQHQAMRADRRRLVDGAAVVVERACQPGAVELGEHAAAAEAGDGQAVGADRRRRRGHAHRLELVAPGRDAGDAGARDAVDRLAQVPLAARGRGVDREQALVLREIAHQASTPWSRSTAAMRDAARSGSISRPAPSASWKSCARWSSERALSWPPTMVKCR